MFGFLTEKSIQDVDASEFSGYMDRRFDCKGFGNDNLPNVNLISVNPEFRLARPPFVPGENLLCLALKGKKIKMLCRSLKFVIAELRVQMSSMIKTPSQLILIMRNVIF